MFHTHHNHNTILIRRTSGLSLCTSKQRNAPAGMKDTPDTKGTEDTSDTKGTEDTPDTKVTDTPDTKGTEDTPDTKVPSFCYFGFVNGRAHLQHSVTGNCVENAKS